jgi:primosomal protein N' (replication factor Y)
VHLREQVAALVPRARVVAMEAQSAPLPAFDVVVGTEAALHRVRPGPGVEGDARPMRLVAFLEFDQELLASRYRAAEQALWLLVRAARLVDPAGVVMVQTRRPTDPVLRAAVDGDPEPVVLEDRERRCALRFPPFGGLASLRGDATAVEIACDAVQGRVEVLRGGGGDALLRAPSVAELCDALAAVDLGPARAAGRLTVDVDPARV